MSIEAADIHQHPRISNFHREPYVYRYIHRYNALWRDECTSTYIYITQVFTWKCVGAAAYIKEIRESGGGDELGKGWKGTMGVGSKTEGENVPREIIDCIRWVSIPGADCAANLSASPRLTRASMGGLPRLCTLYSSTTRPMANVCSKSRISRPVPPPSANWLAGYIIIIVAFNATAFNEQPWCNAIRYRVTKNYRSNNFFRSITKKMHID